ncbi:hypothetical protein N9043_00705 [bacterium]|nr:hypothetical protein [bacterium]
METTCQPVCPPAPCPVDPCANFCPSQELSCFFDYIKPTIQQMINESLPDMSVIDALIGDIEDYECSENNVYQCGDKIVFEGGLYKSRKDDNDRHPHDDNAWEALGSIPKALEKVKDMESFAFIKFPYHASCDSSTHCVATAKEGQCVAIKVATDQVGDCDEVIYADEIYTALKDTCEPPSAESADWEGPLDSCGSMRDICSKLDDLEEGSC